MIEDSLVRQQNLWRQRQLEQYVFLSVWSRNPPPWWHRLAESIGGFINRAGQLIASLIILMALITFAVVVMRYSLNFGRIAIQESVTYFHAAVITLCMAYTMRHKAHVRVDIFYNRMSARMRHMTDIAGTMLFLIPMCVTIIVVSSGYALRSWQILEASPEAGGLPLVFLIKTMIPVMASLLLLQAIAELLITLGHLCAGKKS